MERSITDRILAGEFKNIIVVTGAGVSTNAGIPDYRSTSGIFSELMKAFPQASSPSDLFSREFVEEHNVYDHPIYKDRIKVIENAKPTLSHKFCKFLYNKGWLRRVYTQNIDGLHQKAGLPEELVVEYHGSLLKNNVVLYGDSISDKVEKQTVIDFVESDSTDLILIMGTSLQVAPFCAIPNLVKKSCVRVLVDIKPQNAFINNWSTGRRTLEEMYGLGPGNSTVKIGSRIVSLKPQWDPHSKWKDQHIITSDCDDWVQSMLST